MDSSSSNLTNNLPEIILKIKYKHGHNDKNMKVVKLNTNIETAFLNTQTLKMI